MNSDGSFVVPATQGGQLVSARVETYVGDLCKVIVSISGEVAAQGVGDDLFDALVQARITLEARNILLACNGARMNVYPSPMLRQATNGRRAYELSLPRTKDRPPVVDVFAPVTDISTVATVDDQRSWFERWSSSGPTLG